MRKSVGLVQPASGHYLFHKASFLACAQCLECIYFPSWFYSSKASPDFTCVPPSPWWWLSGSCFHRESTVNGAAARGSLPPRPAPPPWSILSPQGLGPPAPACTYQHGSQTGWTVQTLNSHLLQGKQRPSPPPLAQYARHRASPFYAFNKLSNMLLSVATLVVIISSRSWPWNTLFIVNCKTVYPLKLFFFF